MAEGKLQRKLQLLATKLGARLLRNNCGKYRDKVGNWIQYGLGNPGGSDLIGWKTTHITEDMVGLDIAVFVACEVKMPGGNPATPEQMNFLYAVTDAGGIGMIARSEGDLTARLGCWPHERKEEGDRDAIDNGL